jgi:hypothetical protein
MHSRRPSVTPLFSLLLFLQTAPAQHAKGPAERPAELPAEVNVPPGHQPGDWRPLLVFFTDAKNDDGKLAERIAGAGIVGVRPRLGTKGAEVEETAALLAGIRRRFRIEEGGMHLAGEGPDASRAIAAAAEHGHEFQSLTLMGVTDEDEGAARELEVARRGRLAIFDEPVDLVAHFTAVHAERKLQGAAAGVARTLDDFHDAAAVGDGARYFGILPDDAVFLGTDASERWTGAQFREFARPYFERGHAWNYVAKSRHVTVAPSGDFAWFDELLDNKAYGECRGTGVLARRDGRWLVLQYSLTIPIPNELAGDFVARIREAGQR